MDRNRKPFYIIAAVLILMYLAVLMIRILSPAEVDAQTVSGVFRDLIPAAPEEGASVEPRPEHAGTADLEEEAYWDGMELLAVCVEAEAGNQGLAGKRLVAAVILNRAEDKSGQWPDTVTGVIMQEGQFASYWDGGMQKVWEPSEETFEAVRLELQERSYPGIYYFREGEWPDYGTPWKKVGDHYFSTQ